MGGSASNGGYIRLATDGATGEARIFTTSNRLIFDVQKPGMYFQWRNASGKQIYRLDQNGTAAWYGNSSSYTQISSNSTGSYVRQFANDGSTLSWIIRGYATNGVQAQFHDGGIEVNGTVRSKEVKVTLDGWPDYVFNEDYALIPLETLEAYIRTKKRLPGVPSENEVLREGLNLGDINAKLLEKIEELTLYILQQQKQYKQLETRLQKLEHELIRQ